MNTRQINYDTDKQETARRLLFALSRMDMTPTELAEKSGVSKSSISQYCHGKQSPSNISAPKLAKVLDVDKLWLMGFDVPMDQEEAMISRNAKSYFETMLLDLYDSFGWDYYHLNNIYDELPTEGKKELTDYAEYLSLKHGISQKIDTKEQMEKISYDRSTQ